LIRLGNSLSRSADSTGFFFYAGHGVQAGGAERPERCGAGRAPGQSLFLGSVRGPGTHGCRQAAAGQHHRLRHQHRERGPGRRGPEWHIYPGAFKAAQDAGAGDQGGLQPDGAAVRSASLGKQVPAVYNQFFDSAYLAGAAFSSSSAPSKSPSFGAVDAATGSPTISAGQPRHGERGGLEFPGARRPCPLPTCRPPRQRKPRSRASTVRYTSRAEPSKWDRITASITRNQSIR